MIVRIADLCSIKRELDRLSAFLEEKQVIGDALFHSKLVFAELVGNIIRHSKAQAEVESKVEDGFVQLTVRATDGYIPPKKSECSDVYAESGRGLYLVDAVCYSREETADGVKILIRIENK